MQAFHSRTLENTKSSGSPASLYAFTCTSDLHRQLRRSRCRFQLDQSRISSSHHTHGFSRTPTLSRQHAGSEARTSARCKRLGNRCVVTNAATATAENLLSTDIWQWRKAQLQKIAMFTGPALSIPLADPIMSLVDTVCVGQVSILSLC